MPRIVLVEGDITEQRVDAIVNAANATLLGGGGVDGAIHRRGGPSILEVPADPLDRVAGRPPHRRAVATTGGDLPARWVIHTVGPIYAREEDPETLLASCHTESLRIADELEAARLAFPAISTGVYGYPIDEAAHVAVEAVRTARHVRARGAFRALRRDRVCGVRTCVDRAEPFA